MSYNFVNAGFLNTLVKFGPRYFFETILSEIVFLVSLFDSSLLVYRHATDLWIFIMYPAALLNSFISSSSFLVESLGFSIYVL